MGSIAEVISLLSKLFCYLEKLLKKSIHQDSWIHFLRSNVNIVYRSESASNEAYLCSVC